MGPTPTLPYLERLTVDDALVGLLSREDPLESIDPKLTNGLMSHDPKMTLMLFYDPSHVDLNGLIPLG